MTKVEFIDPMGNLHEDPERAFLKDLVFNRGNDYWDIGSGDAALYYYENGQRKSFLVLKGLSPYGFMIRARGNNQEEKSFVLTSGAHTGEIVEAIIGGEPANYYREYFVPKEVAWEAIEHFLETGERKKTLQWVHPVTPGLD